MSVGTEVKRYFLQIIPPHSLYLVFKCGFPCLNGIILANGLQAGGLNTASHKCLLNGVHGNTFCKAENREDALGTLYWHATLYFCWEMTVLICVVGMYKEYVIRYIHEHTRSPQKKKISTLEAICHKCECHQLSTFVATSPGSRHFTLPFSSPACAAPKETCPSTHYRSAGVMSSRGSCH